MVVEWGLIAGLSLPQINGMKPGWVMDLFEYRRTYDDQQHRITRE